MELELILIIVIVAVSASDFLLSKFKRKGIDGSVVLFDKKKNKSDLKSSKFYTKSYFLIPAISLILFGFSFLVPDINFTIFEYSDIFSEAVINPRDIIVLLSLSIVYILFSINSYLVKIKNEKKKAREVLFFILNIFIILILFGSQLIIQNRNDLIIDEIGNKITKLDELQNLNSGSVKQTDIFSIGGLSLISKPLDFIAKDKLKDYEEYFDVLGIGELEEFEFYKSKLDFLFKNVRVTSEDFMYIPPSRYENYKKANSGEFSGILGSPKFLDGMKINGLNATDRNFLSYNKLNFSFFKDDLVFGKFQFKNLKKEFKTSRSVIKYYLDSKFGKSFYYRDGWKGPSKAEFKGSPLQIGSTYYVKTKDGKYVYALFDKDMYENSYYWSDKSECEIWMCKTERYVSRITVDVKYIPSQFESKYLILTQYPTIVAKSDMQNYIKKIISNPSNKLKADEIIQLFDKKVYYAFNINYNDKFLELREMRKLYSRSIWSSIDLGNISLAIFIMAYPLRFVIWILLAIISAIYKTIGWSIKTYFQE